jgi:hypothetical protein
MPGPTSTARCAGAPSAAGSESSSGWRWPPPRSSAVGLVRRAWTSYRWDGRPAVGPDDLLAQAYANLPPRIVVSPGPTGNPTQMLVPLGKKFPRSLVSVPCMRLKVMVPV